MSDFKAKMHQIQFRLELRPRPHKRSLERSPDPLVEFKGATSKGRDGGEGRGEEMRGGQRRGCLLYTSPSPRDGLLSRMPSSA